MTSYVRCSIYNSRGVIAVGCGPDIPSAATDVMYAVEAYDLDVTDGLMWEFVRVFPIPMPWKPSQWDIRPYIADIKCEYGEQTSLVI